MRNTTTSSWLAIAAILASSPVFAATPFDIAKPSNRVGEGRCHMGECSYSKTLATHIVKKSAQETRVRVTLLGGTSYHKNGHYPRTVPKNIVWNKTPHQLTVVCSYQNPTVVFGQQVENLDFSMVPGYLESSANMYFQICHNAHNGYSRDAIKFGYVSR